MKKILQMAGSEAGKAARQDIRDAAYTWAGKGIRKSARDIDPLPQRQRGRRRLAYTGGALGVQQVASRGGSSGSDGLEPHSMGGTTMY